MEITREFCEKRIAEQERYLQELNGRKGRVEEKQLKEYQASAENRLEYFKKCKSEFDETGDLNKPSYEEINN